MAIPPLTRLRVSIPKAVFRSECNNPTSADEDNGDEFGATDKRTTSNPFPPLFLAVVLHQQR